MKKLDARLSLVADFVDRDCALVDVGTDHAYLPVYLMQQGYIRTAIGADVRPGPLSRAKETVKAAGLLEQIDLRLSDGLDEIHPQEADCIVMAGMGGILITQLIQRAEWLKNPQKKLVLQPMTDAPLVRAFLAEQGFDLIRERATADKKHVYTVMKAAYSGKVRSLSPLAAVIGGLDQPLGSFEIRFLQKEQAGILKQMRGLHQAGQMTEAARLAGLYQDLSAVLKGGIFK